jgi:hypothetical protein
MDKPWLNLEMDYKNIWWNSSNIENFSKTISYDEIPIAYFIIQDANMGGEYFRYFKWYNDNNNRYMEIANKWIFDISLVNMTHDSTVYDQNRNKYTVIDKFNNKFIKILELTNS